MAALETPLQPDRLVAFMYALDQALRRPESALDTDVGKLVDAATDANLFAPPGLPGLAVPVGFDPQMIGDVDANEVTRDRHAVRVYQLHQFAFALTGATAKARMALAQVGLSDGQTAGLDGSIQPDRVGELVAEVTDRMAREAAGEA